MVVYVKPDTVSLFFYGLVPILQIKSKPDLSLARFCIPIRKYVNVSLSVVSKAADKSIKIRAVTSLLSILFIIALFTFSRSDYVE